MTRVFVFTNHKGGVGKSTSATNTAFGIAGMLRRAGEPNPRVLLIDTDSQAHATLVTTGSKDGGADNSIQTIKLFTTTKILLLLWTYMEKKKRNYFAGLKSQELAFSKPNNLLQNTVTNG